MWKVKMKLGKSVMAHATIWQYVPSAIYLYLTYIEVDYDMWSLLMIDNLNWVFSINFLASSE